MASPIAWLRGLGRVVWQVPRREPSAAEISALVNPPSPTSADVQAAIAGVDMRLAELADVPPPVRTEAQWAEMDRLLDRRMRLTCPPVPVVPGRSS